MTYLIEFIVNWNLLSSNVTVDCIFGNQTQSCSFSLFIWKLFIEFCSFLGLKRKWNNEMLHLHTVRTNWRVNNCESVGFILSVNHSIILGYLLKSRELEWIISDEPTGWKCRMCMFVCNRKSFPYENCYSKGLYLHIQYCLMVFVRKLSLILSLAALEK